MYVRAAGPHSGRFDAARRREQVGGAVDGAANVVVGVRAQVPQLSLDGLDGRRVGPARVGEFTHLVCEVGEPLRTLGLEGKLRGEQ
jgi:hypothetical protein